MIRILSVTALALLTGSVGQELSPAEEVRQARLAGLLDEATRLARDGLSLPDATPTTLVALYLELARIQDRRGLHNNSRPVAEASAFADSAWAHLPSGDDKLTADVVSLRAELAYRAEMGTDFPAARVHASEALSLYRAIDEPYGEAEAVHRLGLIALQQGQLAEARRLFEESRRIDEAAGARPLFQGEYERHIAFVDLFEGNVEVALPHLERSLALRRHSGAIDAAMFAANSLASALVDVGRPRDALEPLQYAISVAESIDSPMGTARNSMVAGRVQLALGDESAALAEFNEVIRIAEAVGADQLVRQATDAIAAISSPDRLTRPDS
jgi:tetratricopeptide (TPR) repeat protein